MMFGTMYFFFSLAVRVLDGIARENGVSDSRMSSLVFFRTSIICHRRNCSKEAFIRSTDGTTMIHLVVARNLVVSVFLFGLQGTWKHAKLSMQQSENERMLAKKHLNESDRANPDYLNYKDRIGAIDQHTNWGK